MKPCFIAKAWLIALTGCFSVARAQTPVNLGTLQVSQMGHAFVTNAAPFPNWTVDYFIDQRQTSGGGAVLPGVIVDWQTNNQFVLTVSAPPGDMFLLEPGVILAGKFSGSLLWGSNSGGFSSPGPVQVRLINLQGAGADFSQSYSLLSDSQDRFGFGMIDSASFVKEMAFTSMVITGTVVPQPGMGGAMVFAPDTNSTLAFICATSQSIDPGPRVTIVPYNLRLQAPFEIAPTIQFAVDDAGDFVVTYSGTLQSATSPNGPFSDVYGHPLNAFVVPKAYQPPRLFFRTRYTD
jgi:hypothetical protein